MKRLTKNQKRHQISRQRKVERKRRKAAKRGGGGTPPRFRQRRIEKILRAPTVTLQAPRVFSLVEAPGDVVGFLRQMELATRDGSNVKVDLTNVESLTAEAVAVLLSRIQDDRYAHGMNVSGNVPADPKLVNILKESGFFEHVQTTGPRPKANGVGEIRTRKNFKVDSASSAELIRQVLQVIPGGEFERDGIQRAVVESMTNTENHAAGRTRNQERWWFSAYCDREANVAYFCFFDNGVGIFESLKRKGLWEKIKRALNRDDPPDFLRRILAGEVTSSTGLHYRGKGLPKIYKARQRNQFQRLVILSNSVFADVDADDFRALPVPFSGTLLYWEHHGS